MNTLLISFGDGMLMGRINWPFDSTVLAVGLIAAFLLLLAALLRESTPAEPVTYVKPKSARPLPRPLHHPHAA